MRGKPGTAIRFGLNSGLAQAIIPRFLKVLARSNSKIRPDIITATTRRIQRLVHQQRLDLGLVLEAEIKFSPDHLISDQVASTEIVLLVPPSHGLATRRERVGLAELCREPLIVTEPRIGYGKAVLQMFADRHLAPDIVADCDDLESVKDMVASGGGVALMPHLVAEREIARGELRAIAIEPSLSVSIQLLRRNEALSPRLERFRGQFLKELTELRPSLAQAKPPARH